MPPKKAPGKATGKKSGGKTAPLTGIALMKAQMEARRVAEQRQREEEEAEEARIREEERIAREEEARQAEEKRIREEEMKATHKDRTKQAAANRANEQLERMRAAGMVLPDAVLLQQVQQGGGGAAASGAPRQPRPAPKPKGNKNQHANPSAGVAGAASLAAQPAAPEAPRKSETDVSSDEDVPAEQEVDDWEMELEMEQARDSVIARNEARATRREERRARKAAEAAARGDNGGDDEGTAGGGAAAQNVLELRSPICCVLGHVDTGKTSLLDRIRRTNVQGGEAGGITQQIGATFFPHESLVAATADLNQKYNYDMRVPGMLVIDTPGHESFTNLRSRGSSLCDIAVLVVDIMHGLEPQTKESIRLLRGRKCPFLVALNKVDRLLDWEPHENMDIEQTLALQRAHTQQEFESRAAQILSELTNEGFNSELYWRNEDMRKYVSVVPTSARTGEGISDLLLLKVKLVQQYLEGRVAFRNDLQCTVLEVKPVQGIGTTIDVCLVNGTLHEGDRLVLCGLNGPIETQVRSLLTPQPMRELRVKAEYVHHKSIRAAMGVKICASDLEDVVPGTPLFVYRNDEELAAARKEVMKDLGSILQSIDHSGIGVTVQSSTLGALEALLSFLKDSNIPVSSIALGPLHKKHLIHTLAMRSRSPRYCVVLAFDVTVTHDARQYATTNNIPIFEAKIIYHLFNRFEEHIAAMDRDQADRDRQLAVFPVVIDELTSIRDRPMILSGTVRKGHLHVGTPLCCLLNEGMTKLPIGSVLSIQRDSRDLQVANPGTTVAFKVNPANSTLHFGRQFGERATLYSDMTRQSIDALKQSFMAQVPREDWDVIRELKPLLGIQGPPAGGGASAGKK